MTDHITMWRIRWGGIKPVQCTKVTAGFVWPVERNGRRESRSSDWISYHETWAEAHATLLAMFERQLAAARLQLEHAQGEFGRIKDMKPPVDLHVRKPDRDPREDIADGIRQVIPSFGLTPGMNP